LAFVPLMNSLISEKTKEILKPENDKVTNVVDEMRGQETASCCPHVLTERHDDEIRGDRNDDGGGAILKFIRRRFKTKPKKVADAHRKPLKYILLIY
jgi:hypothetical protein